MHFQISIISWLIFHVVVVDGDCRNLTRKFLDDQFDTLQKSVRLIVDESQCSRNNDPVAFHAYMGSVKSYAKGVVWVYDKVITNVMKGYNAETGKFIAPEGGIYIFSYETLSNPNEASHAALFVNGKAKSWQACNSSGGGCKWITCSNSATLQIEKGDIVYIADHLGSATIRESYTSFTGAKIS
ncbi:cerebellin-1-like [Saccostrea cucullata]|uniref:cerebellin-1-like n=1 Tax=Saccostrea cuccullata TaxID=36930 RepID=UPI002ED2F2D3